MSDYLVPILLLVILLYAWSKRLSAYDTFVKGAGKAVASAWSIFPYLLTILIMVQLVRVSGIAEAVARVVAPVFGLLGIPAELVELMLIRPFTGTGSLALLDEIYLKYGVDTYIARCASAIMGSSETVFYVAAVYFSGCKARRLRYTIPVALLASIIGAAAACLFCRIF